MGKMIITILIPYNYKYNRRQKGNKLKEKNSAPKFKMF